MPKGNETDKKRTVTRHRTIALTCGVVVLGMVGLSFAAVPLYQIFCQTTGYAGTTQRAEEPSDIVLDRTLTIHFDANVAPDLPWTFKPEQSKMEVKIGESALAFYRATNTSSKPITGTAVFNVTPEAAGIHFNKVQCFCFTEQRLEPGESVDMAVSFFIDPDFDKDDDTTRLTELTLSYTFYPVDEPKTQARQKQAQHTGGND